MVWPSTVTVIVVCSCYDSAEDGHYRDLRVTRQELALDEPVADADIAGRLDRLPITRLHAAIVAVCSIGFTFDLLEVALGGALSAVFSAPPHRVAPDRLSMLLSAVYAGAIVGAPALGWLADRVGRRAVLTTGLLWLALTSLAMMTTDRIESLAAFRLLAGLVLGAYPPLMLAYLTDILPSRRRGMLILIAIAFATLGQAAGILLIRWLTPIQPLGLEAWKWAFVVGSAGAVGAAVLFWIMPESPRWLAATGRADEAEIGCRAFEASPVVWQPKDTAVPAPATEPEAPARGGSWIRRYRRELLVMAGLYFLSPWAVVGFPLLSGPVLIEKGYKLSDTLLYIGISPFGAFLGTFFAAFFTDRIERRTTIALCAGVMAAAVMSFAVSAAPAGLIISSLAFNFISNVYLAALAVYASELFPTRLRSSAASATWAVNRVSSAMAPFVLPRLLHARGITPMFTVVAATLAVSFLLVAAYGPRGKAGRPVE